MHKEIEVKCNHWLATFPFREKAGKVYGKAIFGNIYVSVSIDNVFSIKRLLKHELTHIYQQRANKLFWLKYAGEFIVNIFKHKFNFYEAYRDISYEKEARIEQKIPLSLEEWNMFSFIEK